MVFEIWLKQTARIIILNLYKVLDRFPIVRIVSDESAEKLHGEEKRRLKPSCNPNINIPYSETYLWIEYLQVLISDGNSIICSF